MRRLLIGVALFFCALPSWAQTIAVSGNLKTIGVTNATAPGTFVRFTLSNFGSNQPRVSGTGAIAQAVYEFKPDSTGAISGSIYANNAISPTNTFYNVCTFDQGRQFRCANYTINSAFNLNNPPTPISAVNPPSVSQAVAKAFVHTQSSAATTWTVTHNFADPNAVATFFDNASPRQQIIPDTVKLTDGNTLTATFTVAQAGIAVVMTAGSVALASGSVALSDVVVKNPTANQTIVGAGFSTLFEGPIDIGTATTPRLTKSVASCCSGFAEINTGLHLLSTLQVDGGTVLVGAPDGAVQFLQQASPSREMTIQTGPRTGAFAALNAAQVTFTLPDLAEGGSTNASGGLLGVGGTDLTGSAGNCLYHSAGTLGGVMKNSGFGCNTHLSFPVNTRQVIWTNGAFTGALTSSAVTANRTWTLPDAPGPLLANAPRLNEVSIPAGAAGVAQLHADSVDHGLYQNLDNGGAHLVPRKAWITSAYTNATTTATNITGLGFPVAANRSYHMVCHFYYQGSVTTAGLDITITGPASPTSVFYAYEEHNTSTGVVDSVASAFGTKLVGGTITATTNFSALVTMGLVNGANAGNVQVQASATGAGTVSVQSGSFCTLQ